MKFWNVGWDKKERCGKIENRTLNKARKFERLFGTLHAGRDNEFNLLKRKL